MSPRIPKLSVRVRLTLWYAGTLALVLALYAAGVFLFARRSLVAALDRQLHVDFELAEEMLDRSPEGALRWRAEEHHDGEEAGILVEAVDSEGKILFRSRALKSFLDEKGISAPPRSLAGYVSIDSTSGGRLRVLGGTHEIAGVPAHLRVFRSEERLRDELRQLLLVLGLALPIAVALAAAGGYVLARRALRPMADMAARARSITAERLGERLPVTEPSDELGRLAAVFNDVLARLEKSFADLRRFTADASHELRTPLTAIRSVGEVGLREGRGPDEYRETIGSMLEEADRLTRLVDSLLTLSRADAGHLKLAPEPFDLAALAREVSALLLPLAEDRGQTIIVEGDGPLEVHAHRLVLRQAAINLVDNALKYSPDSSAVRIRIKASGTAASLEIIDRGPGIALEERERIFERFYRLDKARSRELGGTGLGLSIARWAVEVNGGRIELESEPGAGSTFRIALPRHAGGASGS